MEGQEGVSNVPRSIPANFMPMQERLPPRNESLEEREWLPPFSLLVLPSLYSYLRQHDCYWERGERDQD